MNNNNNGMTIDLVDLIWKLLMQWKAVLIVCLVMALLIPSAMYMRGKAAYDAAVDAISEEKETKALSAEERIEKIFDALPDDDVTNIRFVMQQRGLVDAQYDYLNNSVWINTNPTDQRTLTLKYYLRREGAEDMQMLIDTYSTRIRNDKLMHELGDAMGLDSSVEYIYELITTYGGNVADDNVDTVVFTVNVVAPDDVDAEIITEVIDRYLKSINKEVKASLGAHSIERFNVEDVKMYNSAVADKRANIYYTINNLINYINAAKDRLSEDGKSALEEITALEKSEDSTAEMSDASDEIEETVARPYFSRKYAVLGFILGAFLYAGVYLIIVILRCNIESAPNAERYTGTRILGEIYSKERNKGLRGIFHSEAVNRIRYKGYDDVNVQIDKLLTSMDSVAKHAGAKDLVLFNLKGASDTIREISHDMIEGLKKNGINLTVQDIEDDIDEKLLLDVDNAVLAISWDTKLNKLGRFAALCRDYNINVLGSVYAETI